VISDITVTPEGNSAIVSWTTDEPTTSVVDYGLDAGYGAQISFAGLTTNHEVVLTGLTESTVYHFSVLSADNSGNDSTSVDDTFDSGTAPLTSLPAGWSGTDFDPSNSGDSIYSNGQFTISGRGTDYWGTYDGGHAVTQHVSGDFDLQATVVSFAGDVSATYCKAVLLFKEEVGTSGAPTADAAGVFQSVNYGAEDYWYQRSTGGGGISSYSSSWLNNVGASVRIRLTRTGDTFRSYRWDTGQTDWVQIGTDRVVALNSAGFVGMGVSSTTSTVLDVVFGDVSLTTTPAP
jgi:regulation of enolase protein 1 (concanavalin A-like superfamily)